MARPAKAGKSFKKTTEKMNMLHKKEQAHQKMAVELDFRKVCLLLGLRREPAQNIKRFVQIRGRNAEMVGAIQHRDAAVGV